MGHATDQPVPQHSPGAHTARDVGAIYIAAATANHLAHCTDCREQAAASAAATAANGASMARRDRRQLGLRLTEHATAVTA